MSSAYPAFSEVDVSHVLPETRRVQVPTKRERQSAVEDLWQESSKAMRKVLSKGSGRSK